MVITKTVTVKWNNSNKKYYIGKGYIFTHTNDQFEVSVLDLSPNSHIKVLVRCEVCGREYLLSYSNVSTLMHNGSVCKACVLRDRIKKLNNERKFKSESFLNYCLREVGSDFIDTYWSPCNTIAPSSITRSDSKTTILIKCIDKDYHGDYKTNAYNFSKGHRCPRCQNRHIHFNDSLANKYPHVCNIWGEKNTKSPYEYSPANAAVVWWKCPDNKHEDYQRSINLSYRIGFRCPRCSEENDYSLYQKAVNDVLINSGYTILHEQNCTIRPINDITGRHLRFDNQVKELNLIVEVHGEQHYDSKMTFHSVTDDEASTNYDGIKYRDNLKRNYAVSKGFSYLEVPYWTIKDGSYKELVRNAVLSAEESIAQQKEVI